VPEGKSLGRVLQAPTRRSYILQQVSTEGDRMASAAIYRKKSSAQLGRGIFAGSGDANSSIETAK
jgi:hypothetical protein